jgi:hypothetical protein
MYSKRARVSAVDGILHCYSVDTSMCTDCAAQDLEVVTHLGSAQVSVVQAEQFFHEFFFIVF